MTALQRSGVKDWEFQSTNVRKKNYNYRSPTERLGVRLGAFWDATLSRAPNRIEWLLKMDQSMALDAIPVRRHVLDRETQHLDICPDSQGFVRNCQRIKQGASLVAVGSIAVKLWANLVVSAARVDRFLTPNKLVMTLLLASLVRFAVSRLIKEFYFKYTEAYRDRDLTNIPKIWRDIE